MTLGLEGKVALVTGGGRNIGRQICLTLAEHGCDVAANVRSDLAAARAVAAEVSAMGRRALPIAADVGDAVAVDAMVAQIKDQLGRISILVNNAAILPHVKFLDLAEEQWQEVLAVILSGPMHTCRAVLPHMIELGSGSIVNISGTVVFYGTWSHLAAAKSGLHGLTRGLAREFGEHGIRVNIIVPSTIDTERARRQSPERRGAEVARIPLGRIGTTREVADVVAFLASDMSGFITGQAIHLNGGQFMP